MDIKNYEERMDENIFSGGSGSSRSLSTKELEVLALAALPVVVVNAVTLDITEPYLRNT